MPSGRSPWQWILGIASLILLVVAGYVAVDGISSLDDIKEGVTALVEDIGSIGTGTPGTTGDPSSSTIPGSELASLQSSSTAPTVEVYVPSAGAEDVALDASLEITFSQDVSTAPEWFELSCGDSGHHSAAHSGGPKSYVLDPEEDFSGDESCTLTIVHDKVASVADEPVSMAEDFTLTFVTAGGDTSQPREKDQEDIRVLLPRTAGLRVSKEIPSAQIRLQNVISPAEVILENVQVQLLVVKEAGGSDAEYLPSALKASTTPESFDIPPQSGVNVTLTLATDSLPPTGKYKAWLLVTADNGRPFSEELDLEIVSDPEDKPDTASLEVVLPSGSPIILSSGETQQTQQVIVGLKSLRKEQDTPLKVAAAELWIHSKKGTGDVTLLPKSIIAKLPDGQTLELLPGEVGWVTFSFDDLPPKGSYVAQLVAVPEQGLPIHQSIDLQVAAPQEAFRHRLSGPNPKNIIIGGVRYYPTWFNCLLRWRDNIHFPEYELLLWEENLLKEADLRVFETELANDSNGRSGRLEIAESGLLESDAAGRVTARLQVSGITAPGEYKGSITLVAPDGDQQDVIGVTAQLRDALWQPFLVIVFGAAVLGFLLRNVLGDTSRNISYQRYLIAAARRRLQLTGLCGANANPACGDISCKLRDAEVALDMWDFETARGYLVQAVTKLDQLQKVHRQLIAKMAPGADVANAKRHFEAGELTKASQLLAKIGRTEATEVEHLLFKQAGGVWLKPEGAPLEVAIGEKVWFKLEDSTTPGPWKIERWRGCLGWRVVLPDTTHDVLEYAFRRRGTYRLRKRVGDKDKEWNDFLTLEATRIAVQRAGRRVRCRALLTSGIWSLVAGLSGLLLIDAGLPGFGTPMHYVAALAWGLGVSTASMPVEGIVTKLQEFWSKLGKQQTPERELPAAGDLSGKTGDQVESRLDSYGFTNIKWAPDGAEKQKAVHVFKTMKPEPGQKANPQEPVTVTLQPPSGAKVSTPGKVQLPPEEDLAEWDTGTKIREELGKLGFKEVSFKPPKAEENPDDYVFKEVVKPKPWPEELTALTTPIVIRLEEGEGEAESPSGAEGTLPSQEGLAALATGTKIREELKRLKFTQVSFDPADKDTDDEYVFDEVKKPEDGAGKPMALTTEIVIALAPKEKTGEELGGGGDR